MKKAYQKAWFLVLPVLLLVAFNALIPMMTVVMLAIMIVMVFMMRDPKGFLVELILKTMT